MYGQHDAHGEQRTQAEQQQPARQPHETAGEHAMLAQLGCAHVQGFGIARPMPLEATPDWIAAHRAKLGPVPRIARAKG